MSDISYAQMLKRGEEIDLEVGVHEGAASFKPEFIFSDGILREEYRKEHGDDDVYHGYDDPYDYPPNPGRFRSVRVFKVAGGEKVTLHEGERWHGRVEDWRVSDRKSKDGRTIIYVNVRDLQRRYSWSRERDDDGLVVTLKCGDRVLRQRVIRLKERLYRFRAVGDPTKTITEIKALGTEQRPIALVDLHFPRKTTLRELVDAELAVFDRRLRNVDMQRAAAQNILRTVQMVSAKKLSKYRELPFVGKGANLNSVLGRR